MCGVRPIQFCYFRTAWSLCIIAAFFPHIILYSYLSLHAREWEVMGSHSTQVKNLFIWKAVVGTIHQTAQSAKLAYSLLVIYYINGEATHTLLK